MTRTAVQKRWDSRRHIYRDISGPNWHLRRCQDQIILHTKDIELYRQLKRSNHLLFEVPYYSGVVNMLTGRLYAVDLYFPKKFFAPLMELLGRDRRGRPRRSEIDTDFEADENTVVARTGPVLAGVTNSTSRRRFANGEASH